MTEPLPDRAHWHTFIDALFQTDWVVYAKPAFGGASAVLRYLGRYTHRVAISNHRLLVSTATTSPSSGKTAPMAISAAR